MKTKELLKSIHSNQILIMKALNIAIPVKVATKKASKKTPAKSTKVAPAKKAAPKKAVKKPQ